MKKAKKLQQQIREHWETHDRDQSKRPDRVNWWQSPMIRQHINKLVCGSPHPAPSGGLVIRAKEVLGERTLGTGVSVGSAAGLKEMRLLRHGIVERFVLYELSSERVRRGKENARRQGLEDRIVFRNSDPFEREFDEQFDLVHWNNSLHHMLDVESAVLWSSTVLRPGGLFLMDDYVGPNRFQWSTAALRFASTVRASLPERYLTNPFPHRKGKLLPRKLRRPNAAKIAREDPSEAVQSAHILTAVAKYFPHADVTATGGVIYQLALKHVIHNFDEDVTTDRFLLAALLALDEQATATEKIPTHYATAIASHPDRSR